MINELIFNVLLALVVGICGVIAKELLPYLQEKRAAAMKALAQTKWSWAAQIVDSVVRAVEQTVLEQHGDEKKAVAKQMIYRALKESNLYLSDTQIDTLIEAAVKTMNETK